MKSTINTSYPNAVIVYGPPACGKTRNGQLLAALFGKDTVHELDGDAFAPFPDNYLVLTNDPAVKATISFDQAMKRVRQAHLLAPAAVPRFCRDCRHVRYDGPEFSSCTAPGVQTINVVSGRMNAPCTTARLPAGRCGVEALLFEPKQDAPAMDHDSPNLARSSAMIARTDAPSSASTAPTTGELGPGSAPKMDSQIDLAVTSRS